MRNIIALYAADRALQERGALGTRGEQLCDRDAPEINSWALPQTGFKRVQLKCTAALRVAPPW